MCAIDFSRSVVQDCTICQIRCPCGSEWSPPEELIGASVYVVTEAWCRSRHPTPDESSEYPKFRVAFQRCSCLSCAGIKFPTGLQYGLLSVLEPRNKSFALWSVDVLYRQQLSRSLCGMPVSKLHVMLERGHANFQSALAPPGEHPLSRDSNRRAMLSFCSRLQLPTEETFSCWRCGEFPSSLHLDDCRLGPHEKNMGFPPDKRDTVYVPFILERMQMAFFPAAAQRNRAIALITAIDADIAEAAKPFSSDAAAAAEAMEAEAADAAAAGGAALVPPLLPAKPSVLTACDAIINSGDINIRDFCIVLRDRELAASTADDAEENPLNSTQEFAAVLTLMRSLTSTSAVPVVFNAGFSTLQFELWGNDGFSKAAENQQRARLLTLYPQFAVYMMQRHTLPHYMLSVVKRLRNIEAVVGAAVLRRPCNWMPVGTVIENIPQGMARRRGLVCPPSCAVQTSNIVVFNESGLAPPPASAARKRKTASRSNDPEKDEPGFCNHFLGSKAAADSSSVIVTASCEHGRILAMQLSATPESLFTMVEMMMRFRHGHPCDTTLSRPLELLLVDVACLLVGYGFTRWPGLLASFRCVCMRVHVVSVLFSI